MAAAARRSVARLIGGPGALPAGGEPEVGREAVDSRVRQAPFRAGDRRRPAAARPIPRLFADVVRGTAADRERLDAEISAALTPDWPLARLDRVLRADPARRRLRAGASHRCAAAGHDQRVHRHRLRVLHRQGAGPRQRRPRPAGAHAAGGRAVAVVAREASGRISSVSAGSMRRSPGPAVSVCSTTRRSSIAAAGGGWWLPPTRSSRVCTICRMIRPISSRANCCGSICPISRRWRHGHCIIC